MVYGFLNRNISEKIFNIKTNYFATRRQRQRFQAIHEVKSIVDDCFAVFNTQTEAEEFFNFLNSIEDSLQFTMENSVNNSLNFLDTKITLKSPEIQIQYYMKPTNTGIYMPVSAYAPQRYKIAAIRSLFYRALKICSSSNLYEEAAKQIENMFRSNGFSDDLIAQIKNKVENSATHANQVSNEKKIVYWRLPFIDNGFKELNDRIKDLNQNLTHTIIKPAFKMNKMLNHFNSKDKITSDLKSNVVYLYSCHRCPMRYIGATKRHLDTRMNEHLKGKPTPTEISLHDHDLKRENFKILGSFHPPFILESVLLKRNAHFLSNERMASFPLHLGL